MRKEKHTNGSRDFLSLNVSLAKTVSITVTEAEQSNPAYPGLQ